MKKIKNLTLGIITNKRIEILQKNEREFINSRFFVAKNILRLYTFFLNFTS